MFGYGLEIICKFGRELLNGNKGNTSEVDAVKADIDVYGNLKAY